MLALAIGVTFLTVAGWIFLATAYGAQIAALVLAMIYFGCAGILYALSSADPSTHREQTFAQPDTAPEKPLPPVAAAFVFGLNAGLKAERHR